MSATGKAAHRKSLSGQSRRRNRFAFEALEPRLLLSADFIPVEGRIDLPGETDVYVLTLAEPTLVHVDSRREAPVRWSLLDSDMTVLGSATEGNTNGRFATAPRAIALAAGTYRFSIEGVGDATGDYLFQLKDLGAAPAVSPGPAVSPARLEGTLDHPRQTRAFGFDVAPGRGISVQVDAGATTATGALVLVSPSGAELHRGAIADFALDAVTEAGRYTLLLEAAGTDASSAFALDLALPVAPSVLTFDGTETALPLDATVAAQIATAGQTLRYSVTLDTPGLVVFDGQDRLSGVALRLTDRTGRVAASQSFGSNTSDALAVLLPQGTHLLEITGTGSFTGTARFALLTAAAAPALPEGAPVEVALGRGGAARLWHVDAAAGEVIGLREMSANAPASVTYRLFGPGGEELLSRSDGLTRTTLPQTGRYLVMASESYFNNAAASFSFRFDRVADPAPRAIDWGETVNGSLATTGVRHVYTFTLDAQDRVFADWLSADNAVRARLIGPQGVVYSGFNATGRLRQDVLPAGDYRLEVTGATVGVGDYSFRLLRASDAAEIALGQEVEITVAEAGATALYYLPAEAGTQIMARQIGSASGLPIFWRMYDAAEPLFNSRLIGSFLGPALVRDGGVWISFARDQSASGSFTARYQFVEAQRERAALELDTLRVADFTDGPGRFLYDFTLEEDAALFFNARTTSVRPKWQVSTRSGTVLADGTANATGFGNRFFLPAGTYTLEIEDTFDIREPVPFVLMNLANTAELPRDTDVTVTLDPAGSAQLYGFDAAQGEVLYFDIAATSSVRALLMAPSGRTVWSSFGPVEPQSYMEGGRYTLILEGGKNSVGQVRVAMRAPTQAVAPMTLGETVSGTVLRGDSPGHAFSLDSDRLVLFDSLTPLSGLRWSIETPDGAQITAPRAFNSQSGGYEAVQHLSAGDYVLRVTGQGAATGDYSFRLLDSADAQAIAAGTPVAVTLEAGRESRLFAFDAAAGERLAVAAPEIDGTGRGNISWRIFHESGLELARRTSFQTLESDPLPLSGRFYLALDGGSNLSAPVDVTFQLSRTPQPAEALTGTAFELGGLVEGQIAEAGDTGHHRFTLTAPARLILDSRTNSSALRWQIEGPQGAITDPRAFSATGFSAYGGVWTTDNPYFIPLDAGDYSIRVAGTGTATGSYAFTLLDLNAATDLSDGETVSQAMLGNAMAVFRFHGQAGDDAWVRTASPGLSTLSTRWQLIAPDGSRLSSLGSSTWDLPLSQTGTHYITFEPALTATGPYAIEVSAGVQQTTRFDITPGEAVARNLPQAHTHRYAFTLEAPRVLHLNARASDQGIERWLERDGEIVDPARDLRSTQDVSNGRLVLAPGDYELVVKGRSGASGDYAFALRDLDADLPVLGAGGVNYTLNPASASAEYRFDGVAGTELFIARENVTAAATHWALYAPGMRQIGSGLLDSHPGRFLLPETGSYRLVIDGRPSLTGESTGTLRLTATGDVAQPLTLDRDVTGAIARPGERQIYDFTLAAPTTLFFDSLTNRSDLRWTLEGPEGVLRQAGLNNDSSGSDLHPVAPGDYRLIVEGTGAATGDYRFRLMDLAAAERIAGGQHVAGVLDPGSRARAYVMPAQAGDRLFMDNSGPAGQGAWWRIFSPLGALVAQGSTANDLSGQVLGLDGDYLITVEGQASRTDPAAYAFNLFLHPSGPRAGATPVQGSTPAPDLVVRDMAATAAGPVRAGQPVQLQWRTVNAGDVAAPGNFIERVVLRNLDLGLVLAVVDLPRTGGALAAGAGAARSVMLDLPSGAQGAGQLEFSVETDVRRSVAEISDDGRAEANNITRLPAKSQPDTLPDLTVAEVELAPPADWQPGDTVTVRWTTRNDGEAPAAGPWQEQVRIRNLATNAELALQTLTFEGTIAPGAQVERSLDLVWPGGSIATGLFRVTVTTDVNEDITEGNAEGTGEDNNATIAELLSAPDLVVETLSVTEEATVSGQPITVNWALRNQGNIATRDGFTDWLWIRNLDTGSVILSVAVPYDAAANGGIAPGGTVARSHSFTLPEGAAGAGRLEVRVIANRDTRSVTGIVEAGAEGTAYNNNTRTIVVESVLAANPDLAASRFTAPETAQAGDEITLGWRATNIGPATAPGGWVDRVQLRRADGEGTPITLLERPRSADLAANARYDVNEAVTLPEAVSGAWELALTLDADAALNEPDTRDNNTLVRPIALTAQAPDLLAEVVSGPATALAGAEVSLTWRVTNTGEAPASGDWTDALWLSPTPALGASATLLAQVPVARSVAPGASYTQSATVTLPTDAEGSFFFVLDTNAGQALFEAGREANNTVASPLPVTLSLPTAANLRPVSLDIPASAVPGEALRIGWRVENAGAGVARAPWADRVLLISEETGAETVLGTVPRSFDLAPGAVYYAELEVTLPTLDSGAWRVAVLTDWQNRVFEGAATEDNRLVSETVLGIARPDLVSVLQDAPGQTVSGQLITVAWRVENTGAGQALAGFADELWLTRGGGGG